MYLYIVFNKTTRLTKIGITENLERRIDQLERACGCSIHIVTWANVDGAAEFEKFLHSIFNNYRECGEWFNLQSNEIKYLSHVWTEIFSPLVLGDLMPVFDYETPILDYGEHGKFIDFDDDAYGFNKDAWCKEARAIFNEAAS